MDKKTRFKYVQEEDKPEPEVTVLSFFFLLFCLNSHPLEKKKQPTKRKKREKKCCRNNDPSFRAAIHEGCY